MLHAHVHAHVHVLVGLQRVLAGLDVGIGGFDQSVLEVVGAREVGRGSRRVKVRIGIGVGGDPRWNSLEDLSGYGVVSRSIGSEVNR